LYPNSEFLILGDMNSRAGAQVNQPHSWDTCENGSRLSKDIVCTTEEKKLTEFYEINILENLKGKCGDDIKGESTCINKAEKSDIH
jgi:hypothetical protein